MYMDIKCDVVLESCDFQCSISLKVRQDDTVKKVKEFIFSQVGFAEDQQELTHTGQLMKDDKKLSNYAVSDGSTIQLRLVSNKGINQQLYCGLPIYMHIAICMNIILYLQQNNVTNKQFIKKTILLSVITNDLVAAFIVTFTVIYNNKEMKAPRVLMPRWRCQSYIT